MMPPLTLQFELGQRVIRHKGLPIMRFIDAG